MAALIGGSAVVYRLLSAYPAWAAAAAGEFRRGAASAAPADAAAPGPTSLPSAARASDAGAAAADASTASASALPGGTPPAAPVKPANPAPIVLPANLGGFAGTYSWELWTHDTGTIAGSDNRGTWTNTTESMVKPWIVGDFLRRLGAAQPSPRQLSDAQRAIVDSDDGAAQRLYEFGGGDSAIRRMIDRCGLTGTRIGLSGWWSYTTLTATDAVRMARCVFDGRAAGPAWTPWLLQQMRAVRGPVGVEPNGGRWGIVDAVPADRQHQVAIKNGWTAKGGQWHLNCVAVTAGWALSVLSRYPAGLGKGHGAQLCRNVAGTLLYTGAIRLD